MAPMHCRAALGAVLSASLICGAAQAADTVKIGYIDPLSGAFANVGEQGLKHFQFMVDRINAAGGVAGGKKLEVVGLDNETNPEKSLIMLKKAVDDGVHYVTQGNGSAVAFALVEAINKLNKRDPDHAVLFLNYAAIDPKLTNDACSFWHFRFDADVDMKMAALVSELSTQSTLKKVYLLEQDYSFGHSVAEAATRMLKEKRPDIEIVATDYVPLGKVKDFTPYVSKMQAAGAQAVITGNWGNDLSLLVKAAIDNGFKGTFYTYYGGGLGTPTAMGSSGKGLVQISEWHANVDAPELEQAAAEFEHKYGQDWYYQRVWTEVSMLAKAMNTANSADPVKVAKALEGMRFATPLGEVTMRADNHQLLQPLYLSVLTDGVAHDVEKTGLGFKTTRRIEAADTSLPTTCKMQRPS